ncbi:MAG: helix-turn-helix domain-containing protein [Deltaproteobacteria bacterium]
MTLRTHYLADAQTAGTSCNPGSALEAFVAQLVGSRLLLAVQDSVRKAMLREALERTSGNYTQAARLLGVQRQAVQQMVSRFEMQDWVDRLRLQSIAMPGSDSERGNQQTMDAHA